MSGAHGHPVGAVLRPSTPHRARARTPDACPPRGVHSGRATNGERRHRGHRGVRRCHCRRRGVRDALRDMGATQNKGYQARLHQLEKRRDENGRRQSTRPQEPRVEPHDLYLRPWHGVRHADAVLVRAREQVPGLGEGRGHHGQEAGGQGRACDPDPGVCCHGRRQGAAVSLRFPGGGGPLLRRGGAGCGAPREDVRAQVPPDPTLRPRPLPQLGMRNVGRCARYGRACLRRAQPEHPGD
mmetsp:Transcript_40669/g.95855  ORF Transcript_40669/g.95855 Transcript_40669/m.95855 type:complete len:240 (+) Transcript_40669:1725-2444(+)